jgi:hypothetical protein
MKTETKKNKIKKLAIDMLKESHKAQLKLVEKALDSGAIDIDAWDEKNGPMVTPKIIVVAILQRESDQYDGTGTGLEKRVKKEVKNLKYFL